MIMELSCPRGTTRRVPQEKFPGKPYHPVNPLLTKHCKESVLKMNSDCWAFFIAKWNVDYLGHSVLSHLYYIHVSIIWTLDYTVCSPSLGEAGE